ncbi:anticodon-binding protein [Streptosporangiaceae bacterium NEAU-GS5]|nr:anticodon-binding protein [Streptosporangiaceae bacterium NEAU-GS5]
MTPERLRTVLGETPVPYGTWAEEAVFLSTATARPGGRPEEMARRSRLLPGVAHVRVQPNGFLLITVTEPGEIVTALPAVPLGVVTTPPAAPPSWDNPGFVLRFAHARAAAVIRWAADLGVPAEPFVPAFLGTPYDRAVLRALSELPSRTRSRRPRWPAYAQTLALAYHDAHERTRAVPAGDEPAGGTHTARVRLAAAVQEVLAGLSADPLPDRL